MSAIRRILFLMVAAGVAGVFLRRWLEPAPPSLPAAASGPGPIGPVTDEMNAIPLPLEEELAFVEEAEPEVTADDEQDTAEVDIVSVVDDLIEPETSEDQQ
ncbi:MAG: hypothetical protein JW895_05840 [Thermoleophilaceae bacterium]|nr:hypothetical protein [Thermoleophilaceae bacterium]